MCVECTEAAHMQAAMTHITYICTCRIAVLGLAFIIATFTQLQAAFTRNFHYEMKSDLPVWFSWILIVTGELASALHRCCAPHTCLYASAIHDTGMNVLHSQQVQLF